MGNPLYKDIKDYTDIRQYHDFKHYSDVTRGFEIPDRIGPVKYDIADQLLRSYLDLLPVVAQRIDTIEQHLESGLAEGKPFIRPQERPDVGSAAIQELTEGVRKLSDRLGKIEGRLT